MSEGTPSDKGEKAAMRSPTHKNPFLVVDCSASAIGADLARKEFGLFFQPSRPVYRPRVDTLSKKVIGQHTTKVRKAMESILALVTRKTRGSIPSEDAITSAWAAYEEALKALAALTPFAQLKDVERKALLSNLSPEQEERAKQLAEMFISLSASINEGQHISLSWDFYAMERLTAHGFEPPDAARLLISSKKSVAEVFNELDDGDKDFVLMVLGKQGECTADDLQQFVDLHPGIRDLRIRNILSSLWAKECWGFGRDEHGNEKHPFRLLGDMLAGHKEAKRSLYTRCQLPAASDAEKLDAVFRLNDLTSQQLAFIGSFLGVDAGSITPPHLMEFDRRVSALDPEERRNLWKLGRKDLLTLAQIAHKMRFSPTEVTATPDEQAFIHQIFGKANVSADDLGELNEAMIKKSVKDQEGHASYHFLLLAAYDAGGAAVFCEALLEAARAEAEISVLLEFIGIPLEKVSVRLDYSHGISKPKLKKDGSPDINEDSFASGVVTLPDGTIILLDAVFDGMGGHDDGALASGISKNVFEMAMLAGWIREPEDTRRILLVADLAITLEQIRRKSSPDRFRQENNMGSTAVICFQCGPRFYGAHCGDTRYDVLREGVVVFRSTPHDLKTCQPPGMTAEEQADLLGSVGNAVVSALGSNASHIHINNSPLGAEPFILKDDDIIRAETDGRFKSVCDGEVVLEIDRAGGDLAKAHQEIADLAARRSGKGPYNTICDATVCQCGGQIKGVRDDKTGVMRYAKEGFVERVL